MSPATATARRATAPRREAASRSSSARRLRPVPPRLRRSLHVPVAVAALLLSLLLVVVGHSVVAQGQLKIGKLGDQLTQEQAVHRATVLDVAALETPARISAAAGTLHLTAPAGVLQLPTVPLDQPLPLAKVEAPAAPPAPEGALPPRFLTRLPSRFADAELWAVEAQDHYLRVHTSRGDDLILMRLADALVELDGLEGARTHRSWWVARDAVMGVERGDGRATLSLKGGLQAPVSRAYAKALREAGWF